MVEPELLQRHHAGELLEAGLGRDDPSADHVDHDEPDRWIDDRPAPVAAVAMDGGHARLDLDVDGRRLRRHHAAEEPGVERAEKAEEGLTKLSDRLTEMIGQREFYTAQGITLMAEIRDELKKLLDE